MIGLSNLKQAALKQARDVTQLAALLPDDTHWGDPLTPEIVAAIVAAATSEPKRVELTDYELMLSFGAVPLQRMVTDDLLLAIGRAAIAAHDKANGRGGAE